MFHVGWNHQQGGYSKIFVQLIPNEESYPPTWEMLQIVSVFKKKTLNSSCEPKENPRNVYIMVPAISWE